MKLSLRPALLPLMAVALLSVAACGGDGGGNGTATSQRSTSTAVRSPEESLSVIAMARDLGAGPSRVPLVVVLADSSQSRVNDRLADLSFSFRHRDDPSFTALSDVQWRAWPVQGGAYVTHPEFDRAGVWEFQVTLTDGGNSRIGSTFVQVNAESSAPAVGDPAPTSPSKTAGTVEEVMQISSALHPDPGFYSISLDDALQSGKPTVVLFSTPAYCTSQTCGPQLETLGELKSEYGDEINFIHIEIYDNVREMLDTGDPSIGRIAQPVRDWGLITEPWTFFIDADGAVTDRFEQYTTFAELEEAAQRLVQAG